MFAFYHIVGYCADFKRTGCVMGAMRLQLSRDHIRSHEQIKAEVKHQDAVPKQTNFKMTMYACLSVTRQPALLDLAKQPLFCFCFENYMQGES